MPFGWAYYAPGYSNLKKVALYILTMFTSTYVCESSFSATNAIKTHERNRLTHQNLENCLRIKVTSVSPDIQQIETSGRCYLSHKVSNLNQLLCLKSELYF